MDIETTKRLAAILETVAGKLDAIGKYQDAITADNRLASIQIAATDECDTASVLFFQRTRDHEWTDDERRGLWRAWLECDKNEFPDDATHKPSGGIIDRQKATFTLTSPAESKPGRKPKTKSRPKTISMKAESAAFGISIADVTLMKSTPCSDPIAEANYQAAACRRIAQRLRKTLPEPVVLKVDSESGRDSIQGPPVSNLANPPESGLTGEDKALALLVRHPEWTDTRIAVEVPCSRSSFYRWQKYKAARQALKNGRRELPRGIKDGVTGDIEAWD